MKITIYELLGLIKDGKQPQRIKYNTLLWDFCEDVQDYSDTECYLFADHMVDLESIKDFLNMKIEIIEEDKDIEELSSLDIAISINEIYNDNIDVIMNKLNEVIRKVNKLKNGSR